MKLTVTQEHVDKSIEFLQAGKFDRGKCCAVSVAAALAMNELYPDPSYSWDMGYSWLSSRYCQYYSKDAGRMVGAFDKWLADQGPRPVPGTFVFKKG